MSAEDSISTPELMRDPPRGEASNNSDQMLEFSLEDEPRKSIGRWCDESRFIQGSPGNTPFPSRVNPSFMNDEPMVQFVDVDHIVMAPAVPFNTPDDSDLIEELKRVAKKQEGQIRERLQARNLLDQFCSPSSSDGSGRKKFRRKNTVLSANTTEDDVEKMSIDSKVVEFHAPSNMNEKETIRRKRISCAISMLRQIVPGVDDSSDNTEIYEMTAKYILFLKDKLGSEHDKDFLKDQIIL